MRISDWSSDVCSSDLAQKSTNGVSASNPAGSDNEETLMPQLLRIRPGTPALSHRRDASDGAARSRVPGNGCAVARRCSGPAVLPRSPHDPRSARRAQLRSEEHTSELQSLMRISYAVSCLTKKIYTDEVR